MSTTHLKQAIRINRSRAPVYAAITGGRSRALSHALIAVEIACLPPALYFDCRARSFLRRGIPVVKDDFVPLDDLPDALVPPDHQRVADEIEFERLNAALWCFRAEIRSRLHRREFDRVCVVTQQSLVDVKASEGVHDCHFAMTRHVLESIGWCSQQALVYAAASGGETAALSADLLAFQSRAVPGVLWFDRRAQECHRLGGGILVNDVPPIPFSRSH